MRVSVRTGLLLLAIFPVIAFAGPGDSFYVDRDNPAANDANSGSEASPWRTIQHAAEVLGPGETVFVKAGVYTEIEPDNGSGNRGIVVKVNGTEANRITIRNYPGHQPIIDQGADRESVGFVNKGGFMNYVTISGFQIRNVGAAGVFLYRSDVQGVIIENNHIHHVDGVSGGNVNGVKVWGAREPIIRSNTIHDIAVGGNPGSDDAACIGSYDGVRMLIENNELYNCDSGLYMKRPPPELAPLASINSNIIHDVRIGIWLSEAGSGGSPHIDEVIYGNLMYNVTSMGISSDAGSTSSPSRGLLIKNNTIISDRRGIVVKRYEDVEIYNNIINSPNSAIAEFSSSNDANAVTFIYVNNNLFGDAAKFEIGVYSSRERSFNSLTAWSEFTGWDTDSFHADADFVNGGARDYRLRSTSPAVGAGRDGENIGAYVDASTVPGPLNRPRPPDGVRIN